MTTTTRTRKATATPAAKAAALRKANADQLRAAQQHVAENDNAVLNGVRRPARGGTAAKDAAIAAANSTPARARKASTAPKPATPAKPVRGRAARQAAPAPAQATTPKADGNRLHNQELARRLVDALAAEFGKDSVADQVKVANWVKHLPTGDPTGKTDGAAGNRYWPKGMHRPTTQDWAQ